MSKKTQIHPRRSSLSERLIIVPSTPNTYLQQELTDEEDGVSPDQGVGVLETSGHGCHVSVYHGRVPGGRVYIPSP